MAAIRNFDHRKHLPSVSFIVVAAIAITIFAAVLIYTGVYNIGADAPHTRAVYSLLDTIRDRSIAVHARGIKPPADLASAERVSRGAGLYDEMCTGCHLAPGMEPTELSQGLYPQAPELAEHAHHSDAQKFWMIKHGVKLTAMPAWGKTHSDDLIWDMVAFVDRLSNMTPAQYKAIVANAPADHDEMMKEDEGANTKPAGEAHGGDGHDHQH
ncbi:c-type cytochrome [Stakelama marina]|uniref:Cytochrome c n=1 Tax=Stakelama marina TaxID=2826939 RepID=A0A8T4IH86_9SPHN|nr:cytochrome c [Stakelama marina]MBR0553920.1 cytochrome c [Stakelama marina]